MTNPGGPHGPDGQQPWSPQEGQQQPWSQQAGQPSQHGWQQPPQQLGANQPDPGQSGSVRGGSGRLVAGVVIGLVAALAIGAVLVLTNVISVGSETAEAPADGTAIELPAELAGFRDRADVIKGEAPDRATAEQERLQRSYALTTDWYQRAFDGAGVGVRTYSDDDLEFFPTVVAVRAASPGLVTGPIPDRTDLRVAAGPYLFDHIVDGEVECLSASTQMVKEGDEVDPDDVLTSSCRRANSSLTVYVHGQGRGTAGRQDMISVTNAAFEAVTGAAG